MTRRRKPKVGGRRAGAGRRSLGADARRKVVMLRLTEDEHARVAQRVEPPATMAGWFRDRGIEALATHPPVDPPADE